MVDLDELSEQFEWPEDKILTYLRHIVARRPTLPGHINTFHTWFIRRNRDANNFSMTRMTLYDYKCQDDTVLLVGISSHSSTCWLSTQYSGDFLAGKCLWFTFNLGIIYDRYMIVFRWWFLPSSFWCCLFSSSHWSPSKYICQVALEEQ